MHFSRYLRYLVRGDLVAVFHELHPAPMYLSIDDWSILRQDLAACPTDVVNMLKERKLVVSSINEDDDEYKSADGELSKRLDRATILYLVLVQGCNFNCSYCPVPSIAEQEGELYMSEEVITSSIDLWKEHIWDDYSYDTEYFIIFYGGEPLLNKRTLFAGIQYASNLMYEEILPSRNLHLMVATNGVMLDEDCIQLFKQHNVKVAVGCDGPAQYHDAYRVDQLNKPTFIKVSESIRTLVESGIETYTSVSITPYNVDIIKTYSSFFSEYKIKQFGFNLLRGKLLLSLVPKEQLHDYYEKAASGILSNSIKSGRKECQEYQFERKLQSFQNKTFFPIDCNGYGNQLVIKPDGSIGNCPFLPGEMGNVLSLSSDFRICQAAKATAWRMRLPLYNDNCHNCEAKSICGGGCAWNTLELKGDYLAIDDGMCLLTKKLFEHFIWSCRAIPGEGDDA